MRERDADASFRRFARSGDPAALAALSAQVADYLVDDTTAPTTTATARVRRARTDPITPGRPGRVR